MVVNKSHAFVTKFQHEEVKSLEVWRSWWPKAKYDNAIIKKVLQECCCSIRSEGGRPLFLKPTIPFIVYQHSKEFSLRDFDNIQQ
jgi:hypothetical protein